MNDAVYRYVNTTIQACGHEPNTSIVDPEALDFLPNLTPDQRFRAEIEVEIMGWAQTWPEWEGHLRILQGVLMLHDRVRPLESDVAALDPSAIAASIEQSELSAAQAATSAESAVVASTAAAAAAVESASAAQSAAAAGQVLARGCRTALRAQNLASISVTPGAESLTLVPWPAGAILAAPHTRKAAAWSLSGGVLHVGSEAEGLLAYNVSGVFQTGLLSAGVFRFYIVTGTHLASPGREIDDSCLHVVQVSLLSVPSGLEVAGEIEIPAGGTEVAVFAAHGAIVPAQLNVSELRMSLRKLDLDYDPA
jgi:hypothetical protein